MRKMYKGKQPWGGGGGGGGGKENCPLYRSVLIEGFHCSLRLPVIGHYSANAL